MATSVNSPADMRPTLSPKLRRPMAKPPKMTVKLRYDKKVRSLAKKTFGSTRVGIAMRFPGADWRSGWEDIVLMWIICCLGLFEFRGRGESCRSGGFENVRLIAR